MKASGIIHYYESTPQTCAAGGEKASTPPPVNVNIINSKHSKRALSYRIEHPHSKLQQPVVRMFCVCTFPNDDSLI